MDETAARPTGDHESEREGASGIGCADANRVAGDGYRGVSRGVAGIRGVDDDAAILHAAAEILDDYHATTAAKWCRNIASILPAPPEPDRKCTGNEYRADADRNAGAVSADDAPDRRDMVPGWAAGPDAMHLAPAGDTDRNADAEVPNADPGQFVLGQIYVNGIPYNIDKDRILILTRPSDLDVGGAAVLHPPAAPPDVEVYE